MKTTANPKNRRLVLALLLPALLAAAGLLAGCDSGPVAPHDSAPALTQQEAAYQAGYLAKAAALVSPRFLLANDPAKDSYQHTFTGPIEGTVYVDYTLGGAGGDPAAWDTGDWGHLYTAPNTWLILHLVGSGTVVLTFDISASVDQAQNAATLSGGGTFRSGIHNATFAFTDLTVSQGGSYPTSGSMDFAGSGFAMTVSFDGTHLATIAIGGIGAYVFDLDTNTLTPLIG